MSDSNSESGAAVEPESPSWAVERGGVPRVWPAFVVPLLALAIAVALQIALAVVATVWLAVSGTPIGELPGEIERALLSEAGVVAMVVVGPGAFGIAAVLATWGSRGSFRERFAINPVVDPVKTYGLTMIGSIVPLAVSIGAALLVAQYTPTDDSFERFFEEVTPLWGAAFVVAIAVVPGFCEEMLFRGYVQRRLIARWGPAWGIGWASVLFALAHVMPPNIALALVLGVWLGVIAWRTGSIGPSIACHAFVNGGLNAWRLVLKFSEASETVALVGNVCFVIVGVVAFCFACQWLARYPRPPHLGLEPAEPQLADPGGEVAGDPTGV